MTVNSPCVRLGWEFFITESGSPYSPEGGFRGFPEHPEQPTRLADITGLDRVGIPVYSAVIPRSNDSISGCSGKGACRADARISAVMEAIERYSAWLPRRPELVASHEELAATWRRSGGG